MLTLDRAKSAGTVSDRYVPDPTRTPGESVTGPHDGSCRALALGAAEGAGEPESFSGAGAAVGLGAVAAADGSSVAAVAVGSLAGAFAATSGEGAPPQLATSKRANHGLMSIKEATVEPARKLRARAGLF